MSTLLYSAELWPWTVTQKKKLEGAPQRRLLRTTWRDKIRNANEIEDIRTNNQAKKTEMAWTCVLRIGDDRIPKQAISLEMSATSRGPGRPRKNWNDIIRQDLKSTGVAWEDAGHFR